eukprot:8817015-Alexandrium_andersonii.AAC.1
MALACQAWFSHALLDFRRSLSGRARQHMRADSARCEVLMPTVHVCRAVRPRAGGQAADLG